MFSIFIPSFNSNLITLSKVLNSCLANDFVDDIYIVANGYDELMLKDLKFLLFNNYRSIKLVVCKKGLLNARILAADLCESKWLLFVDDDNILSSNYTKEIAVEIKRNKQGVIFGGTVIFPTYLKPLIKKNHALVKNLLACNDHDIPNKTVDTNSVVGAGLCISSAIAADILHGLKCSGRTGDMLLSGEDTELCFKALNYGKIYNVPTARLIHVISKVRLEPKYLNRLSSSMLLTLPYLHFIYFNRSFNIIISFLLTFMSSFYFGIKIYYEKPSFHKFIQEYYNSIKFLFANIK